jgi:hypothetical protein
VNRRDLLKLFGAGTVAVPLIGGVPEIGAAATFIDAPKVEPAVLPAGSWAGGETVIHVECIRDDGSVLRFEASSFVADLRHEYRTLYGQSRYAEGITNAGTRLDFTFRVRGVDRTVGMDYQHFSMPGSS